MDGNGSPDFVVSNFAGSTEVPGLPRPQDVLLIKSLVVGNISVTPRPITNLLSSTNTFAHFFHDLNGDGLTDLLAMDGELNLNYRLNDGTDFIGNWTSLGFGIPTRWGMFNQGSRRTRLSQKPGNNPMPIRCRL